MDEERIIGPELKEAVARLFAKSARGELPIPGPQEIAPPSVPEARLGDPTRYETFNARFLEPWQVIGSLTLGALIIPEKSVTEGTLVKSVGDLWLEIARFLSLDWSLAFQIDPDKWEELVAGAFNKVGYQVILTPRSGDRGRDLIATKDGIGSIRILGSVKAYRADRLVTRAHVHEMLGLVAGDQRATKGIIATTSDFAPKVLADPGLARSVPYKLELLNELLPV